MILILKTVYRCRYASATVDKRLAREGVDGHNWCVAKQSAKVHLVAHLLAYGRYDAYGCGFLVHHTDGCLVGYNAGYGCGRSVAWNGYHVETHGAYTGHGLKLLNSQGSCLHSINHALVLAHGNEGSVEAANLGRGHDAALLHLVVEQSEGCCGAWSSRVLKAYLAKDVGHRVTNGWRWGKRKVDDAEWHTESARSLLSHKLTHTGDLEGRALDSLTEHLEILTTNVFKGILHNARTAHTHTNHGIWLTHTEEGASHEGVVVGSIAEHHELGATYRHTLLSGFGCLSHDVAHKTYGIHVDARLGRTDVHGAANKVGLGKGLGDGAYHQLVAVGHSFRNNGRVATEEVHTHGLGGTVECLG